MFHHWLQLWVTTCWLFQDGRHTDVSGVVECGPRYMVLRTNFTFWSHYFVMNERSDGRASGSGPVTATWCWFLGFGQQKHIISGSVTDIWVKQRHDQSCYPLLSLAGQFSVSTFVVSRCTVLLLNLVNPFIMWKTQVCQFKHYCALKWSAQPSLSWVSWVSSGFKLL